MIPDSISAASLTALVYASYTPTIAHGDAAESSETDAMEGEAE